MEKFDNLQRKQRKLRKDSKINFEFVDRDLF